MIGLLRLGFFGLARAGGGYPLTMRWAGLLLVIPAALGGYFLAHKLRVYVDRMGRPAYERSKDTERKVRAFETGRTSPSSTGGTGSPLSTEGAGAEVKKGAGSDPWRQFMQIAHADDATLQGYFQAHAGTPVGARACLQWVKRAAEPSDLTTRRAVFRDAYPTSWILHAWRATQ